MASSRTCRSKNNVTPDQTFWVARDVTKQYSKYISEHVIRKFREKIFLCTNEFDTHLTITPAPLMNLAVENALTLPTHTLHISLTLCFLFKV